MKKEVRVTARVGKIVCTPDIFIDGEGTTVAELGVTLHLYKWGVGSFTYTLYLRMKELESLDSISKYLDDSLDIDASPQIREYVAREIYIAIGGNLY